jgi:hypothetical protein
MPVRDETRGTLTPASRRYSIQAYPNVPAARKITVSGRLIAAMEGLRAIRKWIDFLIISVLNSLKLSDIEKKDAARVKILSMPFY